MERGEKIVGGILAVAIVAAVAVFAYYELPENDDGCGDTALTVTYQGEEWTYTLCDLKDLSTTTGEGGMRTSIETIRGPWQFTGVSFSDLIQDLSVPIGGAISVTVIDTADPDNASDDYSRTFDAEVLRGNMTVYDAAGNITNDSARPTPILAYKMSGDAIDAEDGPLRVAFVAQDGAVYTSSRDWVKSVDHVDVTVG